MIILFDFLTNTELLDIHISDNKCVNKICDNIIINRLKLYNDYDTMLILKKKINILIIEKNKPKPKTLPKPIKIPK